MKKLSSIYLAFVFLILYLPIFYLIGYALNAGDDMNQFIGFSLTHFENLFGDKRLMLILAQTFFLAFLSALIATIIGTFGAIYIYQAKKNTRKLSFLSQCLEGSATVRLVPASCSLHQYEIPAGLYLSSG